MGQHEGHSTMTLDEVKFVSPDAIAGLVERNKECVVLRHRVRQFNDFPERKWPDASNAAGHGLIGVDVETRGIVFDIKLLHPSQIAVHHRSTKSNRAHSFDRLIDHWDARIEHLFALKQPAVMVVAMNSNLVPILLEAVNQSAVYPLIRPAKRSS